MPPAPPMESASHSHMFLKTSRIDSAYLPACEQLSYHRLRGRPKCSENAHDALLE